MNQSNLNRKKLHIAVLVSCVLAVVLFAGCSNDSIRATEPEAGPVGGESIPSGLAMGPIDGLTTAWHVLVPAPQTDVPTPDRGRDRVAGSSAPGVNTLPLPMGTEILLSCGPVGPRAITWTGAEEMKRTGQRSLAVCHLDRPGMLEVTVRSESARNSELYTFTFKVVDIDPADIRVRNLEIITPDPGIDEGASNQTTMKAFFGPTIARVSRTADGTYVTGIGQRARFVLEVDPPELAPIMEWRVNGRAQTLGGALTRSIDHVGRFEFSVGPPEASRSLDLETYDVKITSHLSDHNTVPEGTPVTFTAVTDPPGFEDHIQWLSSTMYGTAVPTLGTGETFTVTFENTFGGDHDFQWLGVKANDAVINQDQKPDLGVDLQLLNRTLADLDTTLVEKWVEPDNSETIMELRNAQSDLFNAVATYSSLPKLVRLAVNSAYSTLVGDLVGDIVALQVAIVELENLPSLCTDNGPVLPQEATTLCSTLWDIVDILLAIGGVMVAIGAVLSVIPGAQPLAALIAGIGAILGGVSTLLSITATALGC